MARNHSSVVYVEPNYTFNSLTEAANDGDTHNRAPNLEDYCIALDIIVELSSRHTSLSGMAQENSVIIMSYSDNSGGKSNVRFMSGTRIGGYDRDNAGEYKPRLKGENVLTSYYADMHVTDLVDYGTTEMLGIKSIDIDYNSTCVPMINIKFTDVRGMSLFQPSELNDSTSFNGIRGFSKDNIAQSFFHSFFTLPIPKFTVVLKGFYGDPVSYQVMCDKFQTSFNSEHGDFDIDTRFIGYAYSFMADVSFNALLAAPYSDYKGEEYWDSQTTGDKPRFVIPDKNGNPTKMPKLYEIRRDFETLMKESDTESHDSTDENEKKNRELEIEQLTKYRQMYRNWYDTFFSLAKTKYGKDFCYRFGGTSEDDDYRRVIILTNGESIKGNDFSAEYEQFDEFFRTMTGQLKAAIDEYNSSGNAYRKLDNIIDGFKYPRVKTFKDVWYDDKKNKLMFDGFHADNVLPRRETIDTVFGDTETNQQKVLKVIYNDGKYQYIDAFVIDLDYTDLKRRINRLNEIAAEQDDDKVKKRKELNRHMFEKMGWYPTVENFTKIVMAHLETLMAMMYDTISRTKGRTVESLGVPTGDAGVTDMNSNEKHVAPFPRITKLINDEDGYSKSEDAWIGDFTNGVGFAEVDIVNGLLNGASKIYQLEKEIAATENNINNSTPVDSSAVATIDMPITSYDFVIKKNPYGYESDVIDNINAFAGKVCMRMFGILSLNYFREQHKTNWLSLASNLGKIEAHNFHKLNKITNPKLMSAIGENGCIKNGEEILKVVTGQSDSKDLPWTGTKGDKVLFSAGDKFWLTRYRTADGLGGVYPIQNASYSALEDSYKVVESKKSPIENEDIVVFNSFDMVKKNYSKFMARKDESTIFNTVKFITDYKEIWEKVNNAKSSGIDEYKEITSSLSGTVVPDMNGFMTDIVRSGSLSFNNVVSTKLMSRAVVSNITGSMFAGTGDTAQQYSFDSSNYAIEAIDRSIQSYTFTECFGYKKDGDKYKIDKTKTVFAIDEFWNMTKGIGTASGSYALDVTLSRMAFYLMGYDCIDYSVMKTKYMTGKSYMYMPNLAALQIGALCAVHYAVNDVSKNMGLDDLSKYVPIPEGFEHILPVINAMSPYSKFGFAKYFKKWAIDNARDIRLLQIFGYDSKGSVRAVKDAPYEKICVNDGEVTRALLLQSSTLVKKITNNLMSLICVVKLTINAANGDDHNDYVRSKDYTIDETQAKAYLDSFIQTLREINGISDENGGDPTTIANNPSQVNNDIRIELYRYLKQVYDKWVAATTMETWMFDQFFNEEDKKNPLGNNFYFIDSFYNKIGNKLLINPYKISKALKLATSSMDTNVMMYNFLAQVYGEHRCMMKCVQNFKFLSKGIHDVFTPVPYNEMRIPAPMPDFVVIYSYESSRNLNVGNGEYKDDGFMLNDEFETPLPIKSRGDESKYYKIPAFGVSYGRQYQSYFKSVKVDMSQPVMTEQAIIAKHSILANSRNKTVKNVTGQDLYDIYSNQSYTCNVEMMGCAFIQPLMYFVLLNVPFFRGSYLISKVRHSMTPGNMVTYITGVRMSKYSNKMVEDMFTDETDDTPEGRTYEADQRAAKADTCNDCQYKTFPIGESEGVTMTKDEDENANKLMKLLMNNGANKIAAAGIVGNMAIETGPTKTNPYRFNPQAVHPNDAGYVAAGLVMWNDSYYSLHQMLNNEYKEYGHKEYSSKYVKGTADSVIKLMADKSAEYQCKFIVDSLKNNNNAKEKKLWDKLMAAKSATEAAHIFCNGNDPNKKYAGYENPNPAYAKLDERLKWADKVYKAYSEGGSKPKSEKPAETERTNSPVDYSKQFVAAIQKSLNSTEKYKGELNPVYGNDGLVTITMKDNNREKLAVLFDIILNSKSYYDQTFGLQWVYSGAPNSLPTSLKVTPKPSVESKNRRIYIHDGTAKSMNGKLTGEECNEKFMQSISKKYGSDKKTFVLECPQFSNNSDAIDKFKAASCGSLFNGGGETIGTGAKITEGGMVANWNANAAANWLKDHAYYCETGYCGKGICAFAVQQAIIAGGLNCPAGDGYRKPKNLVEQKGSWGNWKYVATGVTKTGKIDFKPQVGDVIGMTHGSNEKAAGHVCLYCGSQYGWVSDYVQKNDPYPYGAKNGEAKYWIARYDGGGTVIKNPKPQTCIKTSKGTKCLKS